MVPSLNVPNPSIEDVALLAPGAAAIAVVGLLEAISIGRAFAVRRKEAFDSSQEMIGQGFRMLLAGSLTAMRDRVRLHGPV